MTRNLFMILLACITVANGLPTTSIAATAGGTGPPVETLLPMVTESGLIVPDDPSTYQSFAWDIAADGDTLVVAATSDDDMGDNVGSVYVFQRGWQSPGVWGNVIELYPPDPLTDDGFASAVAISGDTVVVGSSTADTVGTSNCGAVHIFERNQGGTDSWGHVHRLVAGDPHDGDEFGNAVAISGDVLVVGAVHGDTDTVSGSGVAYVFQRDWGGPGSWGQVERLQAADPTTDDDFACSVAVDGSTVVVGAWYGDTVSVPNCGTATIFERDHGGADTWGMVTELSSPTPTFDETFGDSLAIEGDVLFVTAPYETDAGTESGAAYVFHRDQGGAGSWGGVARIVASDAAEWDNFGRAVSLQGDVALIGAVHADPAGKVYLFARDAAGLWRQISTLVPAGDDGGASWSEVTGIAGQELLISGFRRDWTPLATDSGAVFRYTTWPLLVDGFETSDTSAWSGGSQ